MGEVPTDPVASPCRDICQVDAAGVCIGCGRTLQEIEEWPRAGRERRLQIRAAAQSRSEAAEAGKLLDRDPG
jgi:predicted Fe-S protein YdhL (DUF1289 family)